MGDHWIESTSLLSAGRIDPSVLDVVGLAHSQKAKKPGQSFRAFSVGRRWQYGGKFMLRKGLHIDQSNGLQGLLPESENSAPATSSVVSRRTGNVKFSPAFIPTVSVVNLCQDYCFQSTILEGEFDVAERDVNGLVLHTSPVPHFFDSHPGSSLRFYHTLPAWVCGIVEKGSVLDMGGSPKSSGGKLLCKATAGVAGESERTNLTTNGTNSPTEKEIEKYVCYTFATDTPDWWINPDSIGLYFKEALAYFSGGGAKRFETLIPTESTGIMESSTEIVGGLSKSFAMKNFALEDHRLRCQQEFLQKEELANGRGTTGVLSGHVNWAQNDAGIRSESEGSYETGSSPVFDESFYMGPTQLEAELQATSDAIEEMEGKVAIKLMVAEAVLRGIVRAVEVDASEAVEVSETELLKVKHELQDKDSTVTDLIHTLKKKEEELVKLVEESRRKERRLVMDMLTERERILGKIKESEKYVAQKEKELLKMAEHMVELSLNLAAESKRVNVLEKQIKESKEAELKKGRELLAMMETAEHFRTEKESMVEMVRREARLKELRLTESLADKEEVLRQRLETIRTLEAAEQQLREEVDARNQKDLELTKTLVEKERILGQQLEAIETLENAGQRLREEVDTCHRKEQQLSESLDEKEKVLNQQHEMITTLETAEQKLMEAIDACRHEELRLSKTLAEKEGVLSQQLEAINTLENTQQQLREELVVRTHKEQQLMESLIDKSKVVSQHLQTIKTLETSEQQLRKELADRSQKELQLTQSLGEKENLVNEHLQTIRTLESAEEELKDKLISEGRKAQNLTEDLFAKGRESSKQLETIESLQLTENELKEMVENHGQKERFLMSELREKDELISEQRILISRLESTEQELRKETEVQREKVNDLLKSANDTSEVLEKLRDTVKFHVDTIEEKDRSLRFLQREIELLNCKIEDLNSVHSSLVEKIGSYEAEVENQGVQIVKQEAIIREAEIRSQQLILAEKRLEDEVVALNEKVFQYTDAAQLAQDELLEQSWKHETETALIMTALEGRVMDLEREVNLLGEESARNAAEIVPFRSRTLQKRSLEMSNLRSSKLTLEAKLSDAQTALEVLEQSAKKQEEELESKGLLLEQANNRIAQLEQKLFKKENLFEGFKQDVEEMKVREENLQKRRQVLESEVQKVRQDFDSAILREQELRGKESHLETLVEDLEERVWRVEFENMFVSSYVENSSQDLLNVVAEVNNRAAAGSERIVVLLLELEAAGVELSKRKGEIDRLTSENLDLSACVERLQCDLSRSAQDIAEARAGMQNDSSKSGRLRAHISELQSQLDGLRRELEGKLSFKEEEAMQLLSSLEESKWQSEVENFIVMGLAEGCTRKQLESLDQATEEIRLKSEDISVLRCEVEQLRQELRNALLQAQTQAKEASKKIEALKRLKLTLLERIQEEKHRWVQLEEALGEQTWKHQLEMGIVSTIMSEAGVTYAARSVERDSQSARSPHEQLRGDDSKKADSSKDVSSRTDPMIRFVESKPGRAKMELKANKTPLTKLDLLVRENDELRREKEQLLTQKTEEMYKLKREFYKELEKMKVEKKDCESDGSQKESPNSRGASNLRLQAVTGLEIKQVDDSAKLEKVVADHERKVSEMKALWDTEKSTLQGTLSQREDEIKELVTRWSLESQAQQDDYSEKLEKVLADHERKVSEMRELWDAEKATLLVSSQSQAQQNDDRTKLQKLVADHEREVSEMRVLWDVEISTLLQSLSQREDEIKGLLSKLSCQSGVQPNDDCAKLEKVVADHERKVSETRALWDVERSAIEEQIKELISELTQALEKERECLRRQASLEENLATMEKERTRLKMLHEEEMENTVASYRIELDVKTRQLSEAVRDAQEKSKQVRELDDEVRQLREEVSVLRSEMSLVRKQIEIEFTGEIQSLLASFHQLERGVTQRTKQHNLRLQRALSLLNHLARQCRLLVSGEADHMQNLQNLRKAEAEVDLLGDEVDALMDVLEKVYTVLSHYHPVIQHYPRLADLAKVVRNEVLQRLRDSDDVPL